MESITRPHKNIRSLLASKRNECSFDLKASSAFLIFISFRSVAKVPTERIHCFIALFDAITLIYSKKVKAINGL